MIPGVGYDDVPSRCKRLLDLGRHGSVHGGKNQPRGTCRFRLGNDDVAHVSWCLTTQPPVCCFKVGLSGRSVTRAKPSKVEPGMVTQEADKFLSYHSGG